MAETRKVVRATREIVVNINGEEYDALLIPRDAMVEIDFSQFPEDDPGRRQHNIDRMKTVTLEQGVDMVEFNGSTYLTNAGAKRLLESL